MSRPAVSVLLPCRNAAATLSDCIASLESQTLEALHIIAVDDGSRDATPRLLEAWASRDARVELLRTEGQGLVEALRMATARIRAPLAARMDADDVALPDRLAAQVELFRTRPEIVASGTWIEYFPRRALRSGLLRYERWLNSLVGPADIERDLLIECPIAHPTLMIRSSALTAVGGYRDAGWPEDFDLVLRLHAAGLRAAVVPAALLRWRVVTQRLSARSPTYSAAAFRRCRVHFLRHRFLPPHRPVVVWGAGRVGKALAREMIVQGVSPGAFIDLDPRKIGQRVHGVRVLPPPGVGGMRDAYFLIAVGTPGAREEIRAALAAIGRVELQDYRAVA